MPFYEGEEGALIIDPKGDVFFSDGKHPDGPEDMRELIIAEPGQEFAPGTIAHKWAGKSTSQMGRVVRIKLTLVTCAIMMERLGLIQMQLLGLPAINTPAPTDTPAE